MLKTKELEKQRKWLKRKLAEVAKAEKEAEKAKRCRKAKQSTKKGTNPKARAKIEKGKSQ